MSVDLNDWHRVAEGLQLGMNPYARHALTWPPFWMEIIYLCLHFSNRFGLDLFSCIRCVLILADLAVLAGIFFLLRMLDSRARHGTLLLLGYCLNPLLVLLTVQHANFDAFPEFWIVLMLICLIRFRRERQEIDYLLAALCLGMGGFSKTFPLMLWPLLAPGARKLSWRARLLAAALAVGPTALALAPLYVISPDAVSHDVIHYRSFGQHFGLLGLLTLLHAAPAETPYATAFTYIFLAMLTILASRLWKHDFTNDSDLVLLASMILLSAFLLGSGYGPQYWFWVTPLLLIVYQQYRKLRVVLFIAGIVIIGTNIYEYAIIRALGQFWISWHPSSQQLKDYAEKVLYSDPARALLQLPMTLASLAVLAAGIVTLIRGGKKEKF